MSKIAQYRGYFGPYWDVPATDQLPQVPTPVGEPCLDCGEFIAEGEQGYTRPCIGLAPEGSDEQYTVTWMAIHRECDLLSTVGHTFGYCSCNDYQGLTRRQGAIKTWEAVQRAGHRRSN